ncbi:MAG: esterase [Planctomycetota bacterium]|nr:MAG: esterase [Planctomycetota bacterium]
MPVHNFARPRGRVLELVIESEALRNNLLGDPPARTVAVYLPEGYDRSEARYPVFVYLAAYTSGGLAQLGWKGFGESLPQRLDRLVAAGAMGPVIAVLPDCFTSLGGNQYVDSAAVGRWARFLTEELLPRIDAGFRTIAGREGRAVLGRSSGGYGALVHGMCYPQAWGAVACHSGDVAFDLVYRPELPRALDTIARHGGSIPAFLEAVARAPKLRGEHWQALLVLGLAASFDPDPAAPFGIRLPVDPHTCALIPARWERWLAHDPLRLLEQSPCQQALRRLRGLWLDCGSRDQYAIHYGMRLLVRRLGALGIPHHYEEFDDDHSGIDYRLDRSLPFLYHTLTAQG